jgi:hypothetical protein
MSDDFIRETNNHERWMAEEMRRDNDRRREQINTRIGYILSALVGIVVVVTVVGAFWSNAESNGKRDQELRLACTEQGGSWVTLGSANGSPVCIKFTEVQP